MDDGNRNLLIATFFCLIVLLGWQYWVIEPRKRVQQSEQATLSQINESSQTMSDTFEIDVNNAPHSAHAMPLDLGISSASRDHNDRRVPIVTEQIQGSIALQGARLDDLVLLEFATSLEEDADPVRLLSHDDRGSHYWSVTYGWTTKNREKLSLPDEQTVWALEKGEILTPTTPITLRYDNGSGLIFRRIISVDEYFMFYIDQEIENKTGQKIILYPYGQITRQGIRNEKPNFVLHEGGIAVLGEKHGLSEVSYKDMAQGENVQDTAIGGWLGLTDKYWATALIPPQDENYQARLIGRSTAKSDIYRVDYLLGEKVILDNQNITVSSRFFAGAKEVHLINAYQEQNIFKFGLLIDWGWFYFLTQPMFNLLSFFYGLFGNYGISILIVTLLIKILFFPLANKSYVTMAKMKKLQPAMQKIKERYADDRVQQQQELMKMYREEKLNPLAGCLPLLIQIPIFFSLYKVLFVTLDMRHQPFFGWIQDLSVRDPTSLFNLFGLFPWSVPELLVIGVWPIIMGVTMFYQMRLNPAVVDPIQQRIFQFMPFVFTLLLASFPAGLVIYWAWNNFLSIMQQSFIMRRHG